MNQQEFAQHFRNRTKKLTIDVIFLYKKIPKTDESRIVGKQLIRSASSVGANYRAACRARSSAEFFAKMCIVVEEADESEYWLEVIKDAELSNDNIELERLLQESLELIKIMSKAKKSTYSEKKILGEGIH